MMTTRIAERTMVIVLYGYDVVLVMFCCCLFVCDALVSYGIVCGDVVW